MVRQDVLMMNLVLRTYWFDEALQAKLESLGYPGVGRTQSLLLANIAGGEHRAIRLARNLGVSRQAISQILADLEAREIITVTTDPDDRRARIVDYHPRATELRKAAAGILHELEQTLAERIGKDRLEALRDGLSADWGEPPKP